MTLDLPPEDRRSANQREHGRRRYEAVIARAGDRQPWLYLVGSDEVRPVKIGISLRPESRVADMQTGSPVVLRLLWKTPGSYDMEQDLHRAFDAYRLHGEWFDFGDEDPVPLVAGTAALLGHWHPPAAVVIPRPAETTNAPAEPPTPVPPAPRPPLPEVWIPPLPPPKARQTPPGPPVDPSRLPPLPPPPSSEETTT
ncbi:GIY-YIG nuclease family protein [Streptomyces griseoincarnatus]